MAQPNPELISALRETANRLAGGAPYQWSHQGNCNCGHLAQTITRLSSEHIHALALQKAGDWGEKGYDYCRISGYPIDHIIATMLAMGLSTDDLNHLEQLSDSKITKYLRPDVKPLQRNNREHVVAYLRTWANILEMSLDSSQTGEGVPVRDSLLSQ